MAKGVVKAAASAVALAATVLSPSPLRADTWALLNGHSGVERRGSLDWYSLTVGLYTSSASGDSWFPLGENLTSLVNRDAANLGLEFTFAIVDHSSFERTRYDMSVVPKLQYFVSDHWFWTLGLGIGMNALEEEHSEDVDLRLGGKLFFAPEASVGMEFDLGGAPMLAELLFTHRSNAGMGDENMSLNFFLLGFGTRFSTGP